MEVTFARVSKPISTLISSTGKIYKFLKKKNFWKFWNKKFFENFSAQKFKFGFKILKKPEKTPNILTNHVRYSSNISLTIPNAKYISILRDPIGHFISTFEYFHHIGVFNTLERGEKGLYQESLKIRALWTGLV